MAALAILCAGDQVEVPTYAFGEDRAVGHHVVERAGSPIVLAEGLFAAELVAPLREAGLLADALLVVQPTRTTFAHRLWRDLREHRKPPVELVRAGRQKARTEPELRAHNEALGCRPIAKRTVGARLTELRSR